MLRIFLESLAMGVILTIALLAGRRLFRRFLRRRVAALPDGQGLRVVRPLDLGEH
jgi:hypothetical protein